MPSSSFSRRTLATGVIWTMPVVIIGAPAPAFAASGGCADLIGATTPQKIFAAPASNSYLALTSTWEVPTGVNFICFDITGGGGGGNSVARPGGSGARVIGQIPVTPGETLTFTVAAGGNRSTGIFGTIGGGGYGKGGNTINGSVVTGGSGGGGTAILRGSTPLVVAGGGGGAGGASTSGNAPPTWGFTGGVGGNAGTAGGAATLTLTGGGANITADMAGGNPGSLTAPGDWTATPTVTGANVTTSLVNGNPGDWENGAAGAVTTMNQSNPAVFFCSGAGGGGFKGGGSGAVVGVTWNTDNTYKAVAGAGGGGGSSYTDATVTAVVIGLANNGQTVSGTRKPGSISLYY